jgi:hypothetical protein
MRLASVILLLCGLCDPAIAEEMGGKAYTSSVEIAGKQIPLPDGQWRLIAERNEPAGVDRASGGDLRQVILVQLQGPVAAAVIVATANIGPSITGWGTSRDCARQDILMATLRYQSAVDVSCSFINHVVSAVADQPSVTDEALAQRSTAEGWSIPATWLMAGFRIADRRDMIDVRYHFNPELVIPSRGRPLGEQPVVSTRRLGEPKPRGRGRQPGELGDRVAGTARGRISSSPAGRNLAAKAMGRRTAGAGGTIGSTT